MNIFVIKEAGLNHCEEYNIYATANLRHAVKRLILDGDSMDVFKDNELLFTFYFYNKSLGKENAIDWGLHEIEEYILEKISER